MVTEAGVQMWITTLPAYSIAAHASKRTPTLVPACDVIVALKGKYEFEREHAFDYGRRMREDRVAWNDRRTKE